MESLELETQRFETRRIKTRTGETEFRFLVIDHPDKWPAATKFSSAYQLPILGTNKKLSFNLRGISLAEWEQVELAHLVPEWSGEGEPSAEHQLAVDQVASRKVVMLFEIATGKKFPGETIEDKVRFLEERNPGETDAIHKHLQYVVSNLLDGRLLSEYNTASQQSINDKVTVFTDFEDWSKATESAYAFRMHRSYEDFIIEFPLKGISQSLKRTIETETKGIDAPHVPSRDPRTGKFIPGKTEPNFRDPSWLERSRALNQKRITMFLQACLQFEIPGDNLLEKYSWLSQRLVGDVIRLKNFIEDDLIGYRSRYDFFSHA